MLDFAANGYLKLLPVADVQLYKDEGEREKEVK
jgi:hypothetical protein